METLKHFRDFVNEIMESNSRIHKQAVLKKYKDDEVIKKYLQINFDPYKVYGISTKKLAKKVNIKHIWCANSVFELFEYLEGSNTGRDIDIAVCQLALDWLPTDFECTMLLEKLICKEVILGIDAKTINKEIPNLIPQFSCMLAQKYFENPMKIEGHEYAVLTKIDGGRIIAIKENGKVSFYTRAGQLYEGLVDLEKEMLEKFPDCMLDGEITIFDSEGVPSKEAYKKAMKLSRRDGQKTGLKMLVFDCMSVEEFRSQKCTHTWSERREAVEHIFSNANTVYFELLPVIYRGMDTSMIPKLLNEAIANQQEGIMLSLVDEPYQFTRTWALQKVKRMQDVDLEVVGFVEGEGRLAGTLGALLVRYKCGNLVKVGSGFSDELRKEIWANRSEWLGAICAIQYFETSFSASGDESLRFPVFLERRVDKINPDF